MKFNFSLMLCLGSMNAATAAITIDSSSWNQPVGAAILSGRTATGLSWGNNTTNNADNSFLHVAIDADATMPGNQKLSLNPGETLTLTASLAFSGLQPLTTGSLQFRAGLFDSNGNDMGFGWLGYFIGNGTTTNSGGLYAKNLGNNAGYIVESQTTQLTSFLGEGTVLTDDLYSLLLSLEYTGSSVIISASLDRLSDRVSFVSVERISHNGGAAPVMNNFDRIGFLAGDGLDADRVIISDLNLVVVPEPSRFLLMFIGLSMCWLRRKRIIHTVISH